MDNNDSSVEIFGKSEDKDKKNTGEEYIHAECDYQLDIVFLQLRKLQYANPL